MHSRTRIEFHLVAKFSSAITLSTEHLANLEECQVVNACHEKHKQGVLAGIQQESFIQPFGDRIPTCTVNCAKTAGHSFTHERAYYVREVKIHWWTQHSSCPQRYHSLVGQAHRQQSLADWTLWRQAVLGRFRGYLGTPKWVFRTGETWADPSGRCRS